MPGAAQRLFASWTLLPTYLLVTGCASSGAGISPLAGQQGGQNAGGLGGGSGASASMGSTSSNVSTSAGGLPNATGGMPATGNASSVGSASSAGGNDATESGGANAGGTITTVRTQGGASNGGASATINVEAGGAMASGGATAQGSDRGGTSNRGGSSNRATGGSRSGSAGAISAQAGSIGAGSTCGNSAQDEGETDVDCGGICAPLARCAIDAACVVGRDCTSNSCIAEICSAPIVIAKNAGCVSAGATCPSSGSTLQAKVQVLNVGAANLDLKGLEIRYYYTDEVAAAGAIVVEVYDKSLSTFDISVVAMTTPTATADHYVKIAYTAGTLFPDLDRVCNRGDNGDCADVTFALHTANYQGTFDPTNDFSFIPSTSLINNGNVTVHKGGNVIWGSAP